MHPVIIFITSLFLCLGSIELLGNESPAPEASTESGVLEKWSSFIDEVYGVLSYHFGGQRLSVDSLDGEKFYRRWFETLLARIDTARSIFDRRTGVKVVTLKLNETTLLELKHLADGDVSGRKIDMEKAIDKSFLHVSVANECSWSECIMSTFVRFCNWKLNLLNDLIQHLCDVVKFATVVFLGIIITIAVNEYSDHPVRMMSIIVLVTSLSWHWMKLYKFEVAARIAMVNQTDVETCRREKSGYWSYVKSLVSSNSDCEAYTKAVLVDPIWSVTPLDVIADALGSFTDRFLEQFSVSLGMVSGGRKK